MIPKAQRIEGPAVGEKAAQIRPVKTIKKATKVAMSATQAILILWTVS
jgi:hypothetical protein